MPKQKNSLSILGVSGRAPINAYASRIMESLIGPDVHKAIESFGNEGAPSLQALVERYNQLTSNTASLHAMRQWLKALNITFQRRTVLTSIPHSRSVSQPVTPLGSNDFDDLIKNDDGNSNPIREV